LHSVPSRHGVPLRTEPFEQPNAGSQESLVQTFASLQLSAVPEVQVPA
jgi:hypothetical protein